MRLETKAKLNGEPVHCSFTSVGLVRAMRRLFARGDAIDACTVRLVQSDDTKTQVVAALETGYPKLEGGVVTYKASFSLDNNIANVTGFEVLNGTDIIWEVGRTATNPALPATVLSTRTYDLEWTVMYSVNNPDVTEATLGSGPQARDISFATSAYARDFAGIIDFNPSAAFIEMWGLPATDPAPTDRQDYADGVDVTRVVERETIQAANITITPHATEPSVDFSFNLPDITAAGPDRFFIARYMLLYLNQTHLLSLGYFAYRSDSVTTDPSICTVSFADA